jgi:hypothetical protein
VEYERDNVTLSERRECECTQADPGQLRRIATQPVASISCSPRSRSDRNLSAPLRFVDVGWGSEYKKVKSLHSRHSVRRIVGQGGTL